MLEFPTYHVVLAVKDKGVDTLAACGGLRSLTAARAAIASRWAIPPEQILEPMMNTNDNNLNGADESSILVEARRVDDSVRLVVLPRYFGSRMMSFESAVYGFMHRFASDYRGGLWQFYELSNGGFYMAPDRGLFQFCVPTNGYRGQMSADAAGITVCLFACSHLSFHDTRDDLYGERFHQLRDFAIQHAEASQIFAAID